ncbi:hypothetical protein ACIG3E_32755 [Streptomyces sp. NPDC053474]|uniref:hypothetical protein n=1 Tax=Streptomyces sp. NPDC053474 TaxID=3365704 RepID=UPI0037CEE962
MTHVLPSHPSFRLRPATTAGGPHDVLGPDGDVIGHVSTTLRGQVGRSTGPRRTTATAAAEDAVILHLALYGMPAADQQPYTSADQARAALTLVPQQRQEIVDSSARAYHFHALRQPHIAAILDGLDAVARETSATGTRAGCQRIARILHQVHRPARKLLAQALLEGADTEVRDWMTFPAARLAALAEQSRTRLLLTADQPPADHRDAFRSPHTADTLLDTIHRTWRDLEHADHDTTHTPASPALQLRTAVENLPNTPCAHNQHDAHATAATLRTLATAAHDTRTASTPRTTLTLLHELEALASDGAERLDATARLLKDTDRLGPAHGIVRDLNDTELGTEDPTGTRALLIGHQDAGPLTRTPDGRWTGPGIHPPYHSPEGAAASLARAHRARQATTPTTP